MPSVSRLESDDILTVMQWGVSTDVILLPLLFVYNKYSKARRILCMLCHSFLIKFLKSHHSDCICMYSYYCIENYVTDTLKYYASYVTEQNLHTIKTSIPSIQKESSFNTNHFSHDTKITKVCIRYSMLKTRNQTYSYVHMSQSAVSGGTWLRSSKQGSHSTSWQWSSPHPSLNTSFTKTNNTELFFIRSLT